MLMLYEISEAGTAKIPAAWNNQQIADALAAIKEHYRQDGYKRPWVSYLAADKGEVAGTCGFKAEPRDGKVEFFYSPFPQKSGSAIDMVRKLVEITEFHDKFSLRVIRTAPQETPQNAFLKEVGFTPVPIEDKGVKLWEWRIEYRGGQRSRAINANVGPRI